MPFLLAFKGRKAPETGKRLDMAFTRRKAFGVGAGRGDHRDKFVLRQETWSLSGSERLRFLRNEPFIQGRTVLKRIAGLAVCALAALALFARPIVVSASPFSDVPKNYWAIDYVRALAADGVIQGYPNGKFDGTRTMTRYEMAA